MNVCNIRSDVGEEASVSNLIVTREVGVCEPIDDLRSNFQRFWDPESIGICKDSKEEQIKTEQEQFKINIEREEG